MSENKSETTASEQSKPGNIEFSFTLIKLDQFTIKWNLCQKCSWVTTSPTGSEMPNYKDNKNTNIMVRLIGYQTRNALQSAIANW